MATDTATETPTDTDTPVPADTATETPTDTDTAVAAETATDTPVPADTPADTPVPATATGASIAATDTTVAGATPASRNESPSGSNGGNAAGAGSRPSPQQLPDTGAGNAVPSGRADGAIGLAAAAVALGGLAVVAKASLRRRRGR